MDYQKSWSIGFHQKFRHLQYAKSYYLRVDGMALESFADTVLVTGFLGLGSKRHHNIVTR